MPTVVDLSALGSRGFTIQGDAPFDGAGWSVADAGDVNGDGFDDLIVGAPFNDVGGSDAGRAYVIFGGPGGFDTIDLGNLHAADGFLIQGNDGYDLAGFAVAGAGDINGDGFDDVIVGAVDGYNFYYGGRSTAYVIFGSASPDPINLTFLSPSDGFRIIGNFSYYSNILSVSGAGDINGDGFEDIIIGSSNDNNYAGAAYVIFGKASGFGNIDLGNLAPSAGFKITGDAQGDSAGRSVSAAGDVNGDGFDDLIVGAYLGDNGGNAAGEAYVIFGKATGFGNISLTNLAPAAGFVIQGDTAGDWAGFSVSAAGDVNGDGFDDLIVGAPNGDNGGTDAGEAYVIFGKATGFGIVDLTNLGTNGFIIQGDAAGDEAGWTVSAAGDVNGDGLADVIVGAPFGNDGGVDAGEAYVIFGRASGGFTIDLANLAASDGFVIQGDNAEDITGWSVSAAGDVNGDGFADLIVGARGGDRGGDGAGQAYVIFGKATLAPDVQNDFNGDGRSDILWRHDDGRLTNWLGTPSGGFIDNAANVHTGVPVAWQVVGTGDFNGDGRNDILWRHNDGRLTDWLGLANGGYFDNVANALASVPLSWHVSGVGDFNGDGRDDILWRNDNGLVTNWLGAANGGFFDNPANSLTSVPTSWQVAGVGDFNGDGRDDILWRHDDGRLSNWLGTPSGGFIDNAANAHTAVPVAWQVVGTGDFNGDGRDDILWRHDDGRISDWLGAANGGFIDNAANGLTGVPTSWQVASIGDFNGDGRDDILWRHDDGRITNWLGLTNGGFVDNAANASIFVPTAWQVQADDILM